MNSDMLRTIGRYVPGVLLFVGFLLVCAYAVIAGRMHTRGGTIYGWPVRLMGITGLGLLCLIGIAYMWPDSQCALLTVPAIIFFIPVWIILSLVSRKRSAEEGCAVAVPGTVSKEACDLCDTTQLTTTVDS
ncbi:MAG: hypothetical protein N2508_10465 [Anaerolineae bacterium]|nr:hypothetical protein [Anaerolineae bacterium]